PDGNSNSTIASPNTPCKSMMSATPKPISRCRNTLRIAIGNSAICMARIRHSSGRFRSTRSAIAGGLSRPADRTTDDLGQLERRDRDQADRQREGEIGEAQRRESEQLAGEVGPVEPELQDQRDRHD